MRRFSKLFGSLSGGGIGGAIGAFLPPPWNIIVPIVTSGVGTFVAPRNAE